jgi:ectoine hydroxylase-related dioxygenase (phytanoyl-CoA dioxygenase family)
MVVKKEDSLAREGYAWIEGAIDPLAIDRYLVALQAVVESSPARLVLLDSERGAHSLEDVSRVSIPLNRLTDVNWVLPECQTLVADPRIVRVLQAELSWQLLCFETFHHEAGFGMRLHRESWFVKLRDAGLVYSCWIALEDLGDGPGGLRFVPGSHTLAGIDEFSEDAVRVLCEDQVSVPFNGKKGDVLVLRGDVAVGCAPGPQGGRMLAAHYCSLANDPAYFAKLAPEYRLKRQFSEQLYVSTVYAGRF